MNHTKRHILSPGKAARAAAAAILLCMGMPLQQTMADEYWDRKSSLFEILPIRGEDIVMLGNSITDGGEFSELFGIHNIKNRGISSDMITGVEKRLGQVTAGHPAKIFLLIGINDVSHGHSVATLAERYARLVKKICEQSPDTRLYIQSVMPIDNDYRRYKGLFGKEKTIRDFNIRIKEIADGNGAEYIDLWPTLAGADGKLKKEYTNDGLHLNGAGYRAWTRAIEKYIRE